MKRMSSVFAALCVGALLVSAHALHAGGKSITIRGSYFAPEGADAGFALGGSVGRQFDEVVELGIGTDIFWKNYTKSTVISTQDLPSGITPITETHPIQYNTIIVPVMLELMIKIPIVSSFGAFGHGGLGYEFLFNRERNYYTGGKDTRFYSGFTWQIGGGVMVNLGSESSLFVEGFYDHGKPQRNLKEFIRGAPVFESVNLSGFGVRVGLSLGPL
jgi:hypothetical protein